MTDTNKYLDALTEALTRHGLDADRVRDAVEEVRAHLAATGRPPVDEFGTAEAYADALVAAAPNGVTENVAEERRTFRATAKDEMEILADLGRDGWELTGVRDFGLHARRPDDVGSRRVWTYERRNGLFHDPVVRDMAAKGWQPCGRWVTFHYFKKAV